MTNKGFRDSGLKEILNHKPIQNLPNPTQIILPNSMEIIGKSAYNPLSSTNNPLSPNSINITPSNETAEAENKASQPFKRKNLIYKSSQNLENIAKRNLRLGSHSRNQSIKGENHAFATNPIQNLGSSQNLIIKPKPPPGYFFNSQNFIGRLLYKLLLIVYIGVLLKL